MQSNANEILVVALKAGNRNAQSECYQLFAPKIYSTILSICRNKETAEDLLHETFMSIFQSIKRYQSGGSFTAWCKKIAFNKTLNWVRKQKRENNSKLENIEDSVAISTIEGPFEDKALLSQLMSQLNPKARMIVWLYVVEGYQHSEIAAMFERTNSYSKSIVSRSLEKLRQEYFKKELEAENAPNL